MNRANFFKNLALIDDFYWFSAHKNLRHFHIFYFTHLITIEIFLVSITLQKLLFIAVTLNWHWNEYWSVRNRANIFTQLTDFIFSSLWLQFSDIRYNIWTCNFGDFTAFSIAFISVNSFYLKLNESTLDSTTCVRFYFLLNLIYCVAIEIKAAKYY